MDQVDIDTISFYAAEDADIALELVPIFQNKMKEDNTWDVFKNIEMPLIPVLMQMEQNGVYLNVDHLKKMSEELAVQISSLTRDIYDAAGIEFNINSPKQLEIGRAHV